MFLNILSILNPLLIMTLTSFFISRKKILMSLLSLEMILLTLFLSMILTLSMMQLSMACSIYLLVMGACEASLGLSILINTTRFKGNDMLSKPFTKF